MSYLSDSAAWLPVVLYSNQIRKTKGFFLCYKKKTNHSLKWTKIETYITLKLLSSWLRASPESKFLFLFQQISISILTNVQTGNNWVYKNSKVGTLCPQKALFMASDNPLTKISNEHPPPPIQEQVLKFIFIWSSNCCLRFNNSTVYTATVNLFRLYICSEATVPPRSKMKSEKIGLIYRLSIILSRFIQVRLFCQLDLKWCPHLKRALELWINFWTSPSDLP